MKYTEKHIRTLEEALALIERPGGWIQGEERAPKGAHTWEEIPNLPNDDLSFCAVGSVHAVADTPSQARACIRLLDRFGRQARNDAGRPVGRPSIIDLNDTGPANIAKGKVTNAFRAAIRLVKEKAGVKLDVPKTAEGPTAAADNTELVTSTN